MQGLTVEVDRMLGKDPIRLLIVYLKYVESHVQNSCFINKLSLKNSFKVVTSSISKWT